MPPALLPVLGFGSSMMREFSEMRFAFDRPYHVDARKWTRRFWSDVTPFEIGAPATAREFAARTQMASAAINEDASSVTRRGLCCANGRKI
ncbi:MAG: hypothetical protein WDN76_01490 [Alphaproteobacteria bacterium]